MSKRLQEQRLEWRRHLDILPHPPFKQVEVYTGQPPSPHEYVPLQLWVDSTAMVMPRLNRRDPLQLHRLQTRGCQQLLHLRISKRLPLWTLREEENPLHLQNQLWRINMVVLSLPLRPRSTLSNSRSLLLHRILPGVTQEHLVHL
jgi:hypothetical protein